MKPSFRSIGKRLLRNGQNNDRYFRYTGPAGDMPGISVLDFDLIYHVYRSLY